VCVWTLTRNLKVLEDRGLIRTSEPADDARVRLVSLTLKGADVLATALSRWEEMQAVVEERFGRERLSALFRELDVLGDVTAG
jgi:DNA-binding MarR family transcriptional regulator